MNSNNKIKLVLNIWDYDSEDAYIWEGSKVNFEDLEPYPAVFLGEDIMDRFFRTTNLLAIDYLARGKTEDAMECLKNVAIAKKAHDKPRDSFEALIELQKVWEQMHQAIAADTEWRKRMRHLMIH